MTEIRTRYEPKRGRLRNMSKCRTERRKMIGRMVRRRGSEKMRYNTREPWLSSMRLKEENKCMYGNLSWSVVVKFSKSCRLYYK